MRGPLPPIDGHGIPVDEVTRPWWDATVNRILVIQRCMPCGHWQHYPRVLCTRCGSTELTFAEVSGAGVIDTYTEVLRSVRPDLAPPYIVARVRLAEGPILLSWLVDLQVTDGLIGRPVSLAWAPVSDGRNLPVFRLSEEVPPPWTSP